MEYLPLIVLALLFWFLIIRPQRRRTADQARLHSALEVGQEIVTAGGLYGRIQFVGEDEIRLEIAPGTTVRVDKRAVSARVDEPSAAPDSG
jgi:preprotein translocase subunit YajC